MIKVDTCRLEGAALDWAVAIAVGQTVLIQDGDLLIEDPFSSDHGYLYTPSDDWSQGGPLIEEHVTALNQSDYGGWWAHSGDHVGEAITPLIAAMRAIVADKLGDTVEVPAELAGIHQ